MSIENNQVANVQNSKLANETLNAEEKKKIVEIANQIDLKDSQFVLQYGVGIQSKISGFADTVLSDIRAKDADYVGEILTDLMLKVKDVDVSGLGTGEGFLTKIPLLGSMISASRKFVAKYQKLSVEIERIIEELDKAKMQLLMDITMLDNLYQKNVEYFKELDIYIQAGEMKLKEINEQVIPTMQVEIQNSSDAMDAQRLKDLTQLVNRFEKKIHDLKLSKMITIQTAPQIRLIQNNNEVLVEKIQSSILNTIPLWKNQIVIAVSLMRQKRALEVQKEVTDTTNDLLLRNSELLKDSTIGVARESERGIVEIETLKKVNDDLIKTLEETLKIQEEGKTKRQQAEIELSKLEQELKNKLANLKN